VAIEQTPAIQTEDDEQEVDYEALDASVSELLQSLSRAVLASRLYASDNRLRIEGFELLLQNFGSALAIESPLLLTIEPDKVLREESVVFDGTELDNSFATRLHKDGVRQIAFAEGINAEEIGAFIELLGVRSNVESAFVDIVDAMWEARFEHIAHVASDGFTEFLASDNEETQVDNDQALERFQDIVAVLAGIDDEESRGDAATTGAFRAVGDAQEVVFDMSLQDDEKLLGAVQEVANADPEDVAHWETELGEETDPELLRLMEELVTETLVDPPDAVSDDVAAEIAIRYVRNWLVRGEFPTTDEILVRLDQLLRTERGRTKVITQVVNRSTNADSLGQVCGTQGPLEREGRLAQAILFFERHGQLDDEDLAGLEHQFFTDEGKQLFVRLVAGRMKDEPMEWVPRVAGLPGGLIGAVLERLVELRDSWDQNQLEVFWMAFGHSESEARTTAIRLYPGPLDRRFKERLVDESRSTDPVARLAALKRIVASGDATLAIYLVDRIRKVGMSELSPEELETCLNGLVSLAGIRYLPFFRRQLELFGAIKGGSVLERDVGTFVRSYYEVGAILTAVVEVQSPEIIEMLREVRSHARGRLKSLCDTLWRQVLGRWGEAAGPPMETGEFAAIRKRPEDQSLHHWLRNDTEQLRAIGEDEVEPAARQTADEMTVLRVPTGTSGGFPAVSEPPNPGGMTPAGGVRVVKRERRQRRITDSLPASALRPPQNTPLDSLSAVSESRSTGEHASQRTTGEEASVPFERKASGTSSGIFKRPKRRKGARRSGESGGFSRSTGVHNAVDTDDHPATSDPDGDNS